MSATGIKPAPVDPATSGDEPQTVHYVCCQEWTDLGPSMCGSVIDDPTPATDSDQECVVCVDLYAADPFRCPRFGRCLDDPGASQ